MGDEMDECACYWSNEFAMRRLLAFLRQGQNYCTDTECVDLPLSERGSTADDGNNFALMTTLMIMAVILFIFRPNAWRRRRNVDEKQPSNNNGEGPSGEGSPPAIN